MSTLHDFRSDFRRGRTGHGLRANQKSDAYTASVHDALNMMVTADGRLVRRPGTKILMEIGAASRIETWKYAEGNTTEFIMVFSPGTVDVWDMDMGGHVSITGCPWDATSMWFMDVTAANDRVYITDSTFRTQMIRYRPKEAVKFELWDFDFATSADGTELYAPFFEFDTAVRLTPTIFTSSGQATGYGPHIAQALGIPATDFDLAAGTGKITASKNFFDAAHVGSRMQLGTGEFEITAFTDAQSVDVKVHRDIAIKLDTNPFFLRRNSAVVEVTAASHGLKVGDEVFFYGLSTETTDYAKNVLQSAPVYAADPTTVPTPASGAAATYTVTRVVDDNSFEVIGEAGYATAPGLFGGADCYMIPASGIKGVKEPAFSDVRGWPQASGIHQSRLWFGGTNELPDAVWASRPFAFSDFGTGDGNPADAIAIYGIGDQSRVRHFVPGFDLLIFADNGEYYVPGSTDTAVTPETARVLTATGHGSAYTTPAQFDGSVFFVDRTGDNVREMTVVDASKGYYAPPSSVVIQDWMKKPKDTCMYPGAAVDTTPYLIFAGMDDGAALVMHSARVDRSFGWMRWALDDGAFHSFAANGTRLFATAERGGKYYLLEIMAHDDRFTMDFCEDLSVIGETVTWTSAFHAGDTVQVTSEGKVYSDATVDAAGAFITPEPLPEVVIGKPMTARVELNAPAIVTGQGPKAGKMQRLVSAEVHWDNTTTGEIAGESVLKAGDNAQFEAPTPVDEWRQYFVGIWDREPRLVISTDKPGRLALRAVTLNVYL